MTKVELTAPDISSWKAGNVGVDYVWRMDSGKPGPHVLITAAVHGNEICGPIALDFLRREGIKPVKGILTCAVANWRAYQNFDPANPTTTRFVDEDFNRVWSTEVLDGPARSFEVGRAKQLRPIVDQADLLLDIHSMQSKSPALMLSGLLAKGRRLARDVGFPAIIVADEGHKAGKRMRDYAGFGDPNSAKNALLVECGQHWEQAAGPTAIETMLRFLDVAGILDPAAKARHLSAARPAPRLIEVSAAVTIKTDRFKFTQEFTGLEEIAEAGTVIAHDGDEPVKTPYDRCVLIMPTKRLKPGQTAVRLGRYE